MGSRATVSEFQRCPNGPTKLHIIPEFESRVREVFVRRFFQKEEFIVRSPLPNNGGIGLRGKFL